jgi:hypothetical protein
MTQRAKCASDDSGPHPRRGVPSRSLGRSLRRSRRPRDGRATVLAACAAAAIVSPSSTVRFPSGAGSDRPLAPVPTAQDRRPGTAHREVYVHW